jgi:ferredoxin-NADP reductase
MLCATFIKKIWHTSNIWTLRFQPERKFHFTAGQYFELKIPQASYGNHWFTISNGPDNKMLDVTTRHTSSPYKEALLGLTEGDIVQITESMGDFVLPKDRTVPLIFVALGLGITPFASMASWLVEHHEQRDIILVRCVHNSDELLFTARFQKANIRTIDLTIENGERYPLDAKRLSALANPSEHPLFFIAGPENGVANLKLDLQVSGVPLNRIVTDAFLGY